MHVSTALDNFAKDRTGASDVADVVSNVEQLASDFVAGWKIPKKERADALRETRLLFCGWSWKQNRFFVWELRCDDGLKFVAHRTKSKLPFPWKENVKSLLFMGDYQADYMTELASVLARTQQAKPANPHQRFDFDYEPLIALSNLLTGPTAAEKQLIGGAPRVMKVYRHRNTLPMVVRTAKSHFLFGRKLRSWEKTEYPIIDLSVTPPVFHYPLALIPLPKDI